MKIAICDDESVQAQFLLSLVSRWGTDNNIPLNIKTFESAEAFEFEWIEDKSYDVLLLDIQMSGQNGIELAKKIRNKDDSIIIIFITGFTDFMSEGYEVSALHYLIKPVKEDKLFECLNKASKRINAERKTVLIYLNGENIRIYQDEILYIEAFAHSVSINMAGKSLEVNKSIGEIEKEIDKVSFLRVHRSYIVNLKFVQKIGKTSLFLDNGEEVPVSRRLYNDVNKAFIDFYRGENI